QLAPGLIGHNPTEIDRINDTMDVLLKGHPYVKSAIDMACWDILGKVTGLPLYTLLGGLRQEKVTLYKVVTRTDPGAMAERIPEYRAQGYRQFQVKVGEDPATDIIRIHRVAQEMEAGEVLNADANTGWKQHEALQVANAIAELGTQTGIRLTFEQPCLSYRECLAVRHHTNLPFVLDECIDSLDALLQASHDRAMDMINLKISRFGGLTRARQARDLCISLGLPMNVEDSWGGEIATAAIAHLAHSTPPAFQFQSSAFHEYATTEIATGAPIVKDGTMTASDAPGLGVEPILDALEAVADYP
ncbi:MAG: mandelate racemase/muconate lactonizing enzyme family protein, partial [Proteobacteria bacterium]|nr:mandelate racemase/muconate lactonizing enzyme family protein [Pseudomonadota bacterium]